MPAIGIAQPPASIVVFREKQRRVSALRRVGEEQLVHRLEKTLRLVDGHRALAAQVRLQIRHQQRPRDSLARDIADHQPQPVPPQAQKVVVIAAHLPRLDASAAIFERLERWQHLREQPCLHPFGNLQFLRRPPLRLRPLGRRPPLLFQFPGHLIESQQGERIPVHILEPREYPAPNRRFAGGAFETKPPQPWRMGKYHPPLAPLMELGHHVLGHERDVRSPPDEFVFLRAPLRRNQHQHRRSIRRRDSHPPPPRPQFSVERQAETKPIHVEAQRSLLIAHIDIDRVDPEVRLCRPGGAHCRDYRTASLVGPRVVGQAFSLSTAGLRTRLQYFHCLTVGFRPCGNVQI